MSDIAIQIDNISKLYQLGTVSTQTLYGDLHRWWARVRKKEDPFQRIGTTNNLHSKEGEFVWALRDINLEIKQGDMVGIIGKNGAGKSTLLKILSRVTAPTTGQITVNGRIASLLEVGTGFHPELTGRENIFLNGAIMGMSKAEIRSKFDEIVDFSGVEKYVDTPVKRYSSGMYVRLAFAVAAHLDPEILIVDEVLAVGDADFQKKALGKMKDVSKGEGRTVLFVSHNMAAIQTLCNKGVLLQKGTFNGIDTIENTIHLYRESTFALTNDVKIGKGAFDLTKHKNKKLKGNLGMLKVLLYCNDNLSDTVHAGCRFRFDIEVFNDTDFENLLYGFVIKNSDGEELIGINNRHSGHTFKIKKGETITFRTELPKLPIFKDGIYSVDLYWGDYNTLTEVIFDAFYFEVALFDVYGTANLLNPKINLIYTEKINLTIVDK